MNLKEWAIKYGLKKGDKVIADGKVCGRLDLREQEYDKSGNPIPFVTPRYFCPFCNKKVLKLPIVYRKKGEYVVSGELAFHCHDTHGILYIPGISERELGEYLGIDKVMRLIPVKEFQSTPPRGGRQHYD